LVTGHLFIPVDQLHTGPHIYKELQEYHGGRPVKSDWYLSFQDPANKFHLPVMVQRKIAPFRDQETDEERK
jgi:hypothetical protein